MIYNTPIDKIQLGIVGLGRLGRKHAENIRFRIPQAKLQAACSLIPQELEWAERELQPSYCTSKYEDLLQDKELDGIVIATNSAYHCSMICAAAEAGIQHLFCEKPLGMNQKEIDRIQDTVSRSKVRFLQIGFNRRFDPSLRIMKEKIDTGALGKLVLLKFTNRDPSWKAEDLLRFSPTSGGLVFDMLSHDYDLARWLSGSDAEQVYGMGGVYGYAGLEELKDWDNCTLLLRLRSGVMVFMETSRTSSSGYQVEVEAFGTEGAVRMGVLPTQNRLLHYNTGRLSQDTVSNFFEYWEPTFLAELTHFVQCVREGTQPLVGLEDGYKAVQWALAATEAVRTGREQVL
ncbi:MAG: Gfo/Idh/MocA family oxidoreductase [Spirochaetales bacterium]